MKNLGAQIKERRKSLKLTQQELADLAGISYSRKVSQNERYFFYLYKM